MYQEDVEVMQARFQSKLAGEKALIEQENEALLAEAQNCDKQLQMHKNELKTKLDSQKWEVDEEIKEQRDKAKSDN